MMRQMQFEGDSVQFGIGCGRNGDYIQYQLFMILEPKSMSSSFFGKLERTSDQTS